MPTVADKAFEPWKNEALTTIDQTLDVLTMLRAKQWLCRGQSSKYPKLLTSFDTHTPAGLSRTEQLRRERSSINFFRSTTRYFSHGEEPAAHDDLVALMVLRHYGVPTRLLDWSHSPFVAAYFAFADNDEHDGQIWSFDEIQYEIEGDKQWDRIRMQPMPKGGDGFRRGAEIEAFLPADPEYPWFVCYFYNLFAGFHRQKAQEGAFSLTPEFGRDHANAIATLLHQTAHYVRYTVNADLKSELMGILRQKHGICRESLFPDSAGAAATTQATIFPDRSRRRIDKGFNFPTGKL
jgi:hypothetical protein